MAQAAMQTPAQAPDGPVVERVQTGVRLEKRMLKVLKGLAEYLDITLGDLLEGVVLHAFAGRAPFSEGTRARIRELQGVYGMDYGVKAAHRMREAAGEPPDPAESPALGWDDLSDAGVAHAFASGALVGAEFHHAHHVRVAWVLLREHGPAEALPLMRAGIHRIAQAHGHPGLYHETITAAYLHLIHASAQAEPGLGWELFRERHPALFQWPSALLAEHYSPERLNDPDARANFLLPDRAPLP
ncbi:MAG TPA: hypothetical protein VKB51_02755 [bacterium]|nr:hypothetical protein [bacterium]